MKKPKVVAIPKNGQNLSADQINEHEQVVCPVRRGAYEGSPMKWLSAVPKNPSRGSSKLRAVERAGRNERRPVRGCVLDGGPHKIVIRHPKKLMTRKGTRLRGVKP
jgi:hypothetical protein